MALIVVGRTPLAWLLLHLNACTPAITWAGRRPISQEALAEVPSGEWMSWIAEALGVSRGASWSEWLAGAERQQGSWWEAWADWITARSANPRPRPETHGSERYPVLGSAPGLYVRDLASA